MKKYWLYLEPYVFVAFKEGVALLYNTLDSSRFLVENGECIGLLKDIYKPDNCGVISVSEEHLRDERISDFVSKLRQLFMGDIIDESLTSKKPVQLLPILNMQKELKQDGTREEVLGDAIATTLGTITLYINSAGLHNQERVLDYHRQIPYPCGGYSEEIPPANLIPFLEHMASLGVDTINLMGGDLFKYTGISQLLERIKNLPINFTIGMQLEMVNEGIFTGLPEDNIRFEIFIDPCSDFADIKSRVLLLSNHNITYSFSIIITEECDVEKAEWIIDACNVNNYKLLPVFNGSNYEFFRENVFIDEDDILVNPIPMKRIFANQTINSFFFGHLTITPDSKVYAGINEKPIGVLSDPIHELLLRELDEGPSWRKIRNTEPCSQCVYQWLCPPISNYEQALEKINLCSLRP